MWCRIHQWNLSKSLDSGTPPSPRLRAHLARCRTCRRHYQALADLEGRLRDQAGSAADLSPALRARILSAAGGPAEAARPRAFRRVLLPAAGLAAAACVALAVAVHLAAPEPTVPPSAPPPVARTGGQDASVLEVLTPDAMIHRSLEQARQIASMTLEDPMERLSRETRAVADALLAYLPTDLIDSASAPAPASAPATGSQG